MDQHVDYGFPPRSFADVLVRGRARIWNLIPAGVIFAVLVYEVCREANLITIGLLVFVGMNCYPMLMAAFRPPRIAIRDGWFFFRFGQLRFSCPAEDVAALEQDAEALRLTVADLSRIEPKSARQRMASGGEGRGCQIGIPPGIYRLSQVNQVRSALGMPEQAASSAAGSSGEFHAGLPQRRPLVTATLIATCVIVYVVQAIFTRSFLGATTESYIDWGANYAPRTLAGQWWRLLTHLFLHGGPIHLLVNMWALWDIGRLLERIVGHAALAVVYFLAGVAGGMASMAFHPHIVSLGASGAIFGIIGALFGLLLHAHDAVPPARLKQLRGGIVAVVIFNVFFGLSVPGIDNAAHAGGAIAGLLAGLVLVPASRGGHWLRLAALVVSGVAATLLAGRFLPPAPHDFIAVLRQFPQKQEQILGSFRELEDDHRQGKLSDRELADRIETEVAAPWRDLTAGVVEAMQDNAGTERQERVKNYLGLRQTAFDELVAGLRGGGRDRFLRSRAADQSANMIAEELNNADQKP